MRSLRGETSASHPPRSDREHGLELLTMSEAARLLRIDVKTLVRHVQSNEIGFLNVGLGKKRPRRRFTIEQIKNFISWRSQATRESSVSLVARRTIRSSETIVRRYER